MKVKVNWDLESDGKVYSPKEVGLETIVNVPDQIDDEEVSDWLSDKYGWCVNSWIDMNAFKNYNNS